MKVFVFLAITLLFAGLVRSEDEPDYDDDLSDLAEDDDFNPDFQQHTTHIEIGHFTGHAHGLKHMYLQCQRRFVQIERRCRVKLHRLQVTYRRYTIKVRKARISLRYWTKKYRWCLRFCWWRQAGLRRKGDQSPVEEE